MVVGRGRVYATVNSKPYPLHPKPYSQSGKVGKWFTEIGAWPKTSSNFLAVYVSFLPSFMSANFGFIVRNLGAWVFSVHEMTASTLRTAFRTTPKMPCPKYWRDSKHGGIAFLGGVAFPQILAVPERSQNHVRNALPQVLAGFRSNQRHGGIAFPQVLEVPGPTVNVLSPSTGRTTNDPDEPRIRACGVAGRCEERNTVFVRGSKLGRSHQEASSFWRPCGVPDCPERKVGRLGFRTKRAGTHFPIFRL